VAMQISQAEQTSEFAGIYISDNSGKLKEVDLNETPMMRNKRLRERVDALMKTGTFVSLFLIKSTRMKTLAQSLRSNTLQV
jgi:regulatory protein NPR1